LRKNKWLYYENDTRSYNTDVWPDPEFISGEMGGAKR